MNYTKRGEWRIVKSGITYQIYSGNYKVAEGIYNKANAELIIQAPKLYELNRLRKSCPKKADN